MIRVKGVSLHSSLSGVQGNSLSFDFLLTQPFTLFDMSTQSVILPQRVHLFPFRTQKLSSAEATILAWRRAGKIVHRQHRTAKLNIGLAVSIYIPLGSRLSDVACGLYSSLAHVDSTQQAELFTDFVQGEIFTSFIFLLSSVGRAHDC